MKISEQLFEDVLSGKLKGTFALRNGIRFDSIQCCRNVSDYHTSHPYRLHDNIHNFSYKSNGLYSTDNKEFDLDIVDFIPETNMETKELKIEVPEGFEIDKENSSFEKILFKKKDTKPRSWEEYITNYVINGKEHYIAADSTIYKINYNCIGSKFAEISTSKNKVPTKELAEAFLAMMQLVSLRQDWIHKWSIDNGMVGDWKPNYDMNMASNWCIEYEPNPGVFSIENHCKTNGGGLSFPSKEMTKDFMNCFIDLLYIAKPLI